MNGTGGSMVEAARASDLKIGSFTDHGPWLVELDKFPWLNGIDELRDATRREVPRLVRRRFFPPLTRMVWVGANLGRAFGGWGLRDRKRGREISHAGLSRRLRIAFERLGPTYIKLGQILSSGEGIFPEELVEEFKKCRDAVPPESFATVRRVIEDSLGRPIEEVFSHISETPIAAASIAQVHAATLVTGEEVVVKVQRPSVAKLVRKDLAVMSWIAKFLVGRIPVSALANPPALVDLFAETIVEELDFRLEGQNMLDVAYVLADTDNRAIVVPRPHPELVAPRILVMERLNGFSYDDVDGMRAAGIDTQTVLRALIIGFYEGAMLYGVFHGDLHGGNMLVLPDGRVGMLDFGITGRLDEPRRLAFLSLMVGGMSSDLRMQLVALRDLGAFPPDTDLELVIQDLGLEHGLKDPTKMSAEDLMKELRDLMKALLGYGARLPKVLMLYVKDMLFVDGTVSKYAPDVNLFDSIVEMSNHFISLHGERIASDIGVDPETLAVDLDGMKSMMGIDAEVESLTYRDLQKRREIISKRMQEHRAK